MPICSYLAYPRRGAKRDLHSELDAMEYCEVTAAENQDILILVTDTPNEDVEKKLQEDLKGLEFLQSLGMTFGHVDD